MSVLAVDIETLRSSAESPAPSPPLPSPLPPLDEELETGEALLQSSSLLLRKSSRLTGETPSTNSSWRSRRTSTTRSHETASTPPSEEMVERIVSREKEFGGSEFKMRVSVGEGSVEGSGGGGVGDGEDGLDAEARGIFGARRKKSKSVAVENEKRRGHDGG